MDWLLHQIEDLINPKYARSEHNKLSGRQDNVLARRRLVAAISKAKAQPRTCIVQYSSIEYFVQSASDPDLEHVVTIQEGAQALCDCKARSLQHICWHIVKCLMHKGVSEPTMLLHLGTNWGSDVGGYEALASTSSQVPSTLGPVNAGANPSTACATGPAAQGSIRFPEPLTNSTWGRPEAQALCARILATADGTPAGGVNWIMLKNSLTGVLEAANRREAVQIVPSLLLPNPDAPPGNSLKRLLRHGEKPKRKDIPKAHHPAGNLSGGGFLRALAKQAATKRPRTVAAQIDLEAQKAADEARKKPGKEKQGGGQPTGSVLKLHNATAQHSHPQLSSSFTPLHSIAANHWPTSGVNQGLPSLPLPNAPQGTTSCSTPMLSFYNSSFPNISNIVTSNPPTDLATIWQLAQTLQGAAPPAVFPGIPPSG